MKKIKNIILDIDNVILDSREFQETMPPKGSDDREAWNKHHEYVYLCKNNEDFKDVIQFYVDRGLEKLFFITSREDIGKLKERTLEQLQNFLQDIENIQNIKCYLYMRNKNDYSPSWIVKQNILYTHIIPYYDVYVAFDDDISNIDMYKAHNIKAIHYDKYLN